MFTQAPRQRVPLVQAHVPALQVCPVVQARPHWPQFWVLVWRLTHEPLQFVVPGAQTVVHAPFEQT